ncbi:MAG TPA: lytic transglycosylase domain-containing protein, partial [Candidatus Acidoferrum sp.]|nr:lytic transglycosylase domain-containing protein [Candidatus Acidoferrum sp.]
MASLILALWFSSAQAASGPLASLVRAFRESPTSARRTAVTNYSGSHPKDAPLAALALGITAYEQHDYASTIALLQPIPTEVPALADYAAYYLAAARVEAGDTAPVATLLAPTHRDSLASPFAMRSWLVEARALSKTNPQEAIQLLLDHYADLPQPETDINLADFYLAANQLTAAADYYQRVYYSYTAGDACTRAAAGLAILKDKMGAGYPAPSISLQLRRADRLLDARDYVRAKAEYILLQGDLARVGEGASDFQRGATDQAWTYLRGLTLADGEADAERLYYMVECARRRDDDAAMSAALERLAALYRTSPWRLRALNTAANRYVLSNRPDDYVPLLRAVYRDFPLTPGAAQAHWKVTFQAWLRNQSDARTLLREHVRDYASHSSTAGAALYFLGRSYEKTGEFAAARICYQQILSAFENHYYAMLARTRMKAAEIASANGHAEVAQFLSGLRFTAPPAINEIATVPTTARIERSRLLRSAGLNDLADSELRFGARRDGQPALLAMEMANSSDATHQSLRTMKLLNPDYLNLPVVAAPRKFWELLFPLPYKGDLVRNCANRDLDPYLLAGLIRQESEFNPTAISPAKAYGLTQIRPVTGRQFARKAGVNVFSTRLLSQPAANLQIGSMILKSMLIAQGG